MQQVVAQIHPICAGFLIVGIGVVGRSRLALQQVFYLTSIIDYSSSLVTASLLQGAAIVAAAPGIDSRTLTPRQQGWLRGGRYLSQYVQVFFVACIHGSFSTDRPTSFPMQLPALERHNTPHHTWQVGQAVMAMCEEEENVQALSGATSPGVDCYGGAGEGFRIATYQGYLNQKTPAE